MPAVTQIRKQRRTKGKLAAGEGTRAVIATIVVVCVLLTGFFVTANSYLSSDRSESPKSKIAPLTASTQGEAAHRTASIVMETGNKGRCEERQFDNRTGKIVSSNTVDCDARLAPERDATPSENLSGERMRAIYGAFRK
jgi:hypothetical protein